MRSTAHLAVALALVAFAATPGHARDIARRKERQQQRIAAGVESGRLSPTEAGRLERQETALNHEEQAMRAANGGTLSAGERRVIIHQQNRLSHRVWRQKHDGNDR
jgi:hypothetical protein